ncbi:MAG TPA: SpoIID/LytB domain-containing protein, partial [Acidimicrobiales bacterium]|nr:SpoIID/LytB domain-containing protein [Acidimicrobiales bacterium]
SYALADIADNGIADICDTTSCQVYGGDPAQYGTASLWQQSNAAVAATAGLVLDCGADAACGAPAQIALTEFSSSTGGYTAGGAFPAVPDLGDATPSNPNHDWTALISTSTVGSVFGVGALQAIVVTGRNGLGSLGGRVTQMAIVGSKSRVTISGNTFALAMGLKSNWFGFSNVAATSGGDNGYEIALSNGGIYTYGGAGFYGSARGKNPPSPIVGMAATPDGRGYWLVLSDGGIYTFGDAGFYGSARGTTPAPTVVGITATADGGGYLLVASNGEIYSYGDSPYFGDPATTGSGAAGVAVGVALHPA